MQVKLLRAIQEMAVRPIGMETEVSVDVRILSATHKDLAQMVEAGDFRQDLYYRINVIELPMPWLHQRTDDIPILVEHLLRKISNSWGNEQLRISKAALQALQAYRFPGNVRELENILERAVTLCDGSMIETDDLHLPDSSVDFTDTVILDKAKVLAPDNLKQGLNDQERDVIIKALEQTRYNKTAAAKLLGISFRALRYRIKKLGIE